MTLNVNFDLKEDGAKVLRAAFLGALAVLVTEINSADFKWDRVLGGLLLAGAVRGVAAFFEVPTVPAHEVITLKPTASDNSANKVAEAKAKP